MMTFALLSCCQCKWRFVVDEDDGDDNDDDDNDDKDDENPKWYAVMPLMPSYAVLHEVRSV